MYACALYTVAQGNIAWLMIGVVSLCSYPYVAIAFVKTCILTIREQFNYRNTYYIQSVYVCCIGGSFYVHRLGRHYSVKMWIAWFEPASTHNYFETQIWQLKCNGRR